MLSLRLPPQQELLRGQITQVSVRAHGVVDLLPLAQLAIERRQENMAFGDRK